MRVTFVKTIGSRDRVYVRFPDGRVTAEWRALPDRGALVFDFP